MPDKHSILSASSAHRWLNCPPSAQICAAAPDTGSSYAAEGTLAHEICETKLQGFISATPKRNTTAKLNKLKKNEMYAPEMDGYTDIYVDYIKEIALSFSTKAMVNVEKRVDYSEYAPDGFGTADCIIIHDKDLYVIDFKYGKGVSVSAVDNPQLKLYALGAYSEYSMFYPIEHIHLNIVQPRISNISEWVMSLNDLLAWGESIKPVAKLAYEGGGDFKSGDHCRFCAIKETCRRRASDNLELARYEFAKPAAIAKDGAANITDEEVGRILALAKNLKKWVEDLESYALRTVLKGGSIPGWKAVEGRGTRKWSADDKVIEDRLTKLGIPKEMAYERSILSVAKLEDVVGKKAFKDFSDLFIKTKGAPTIVPEDDPRPEYRECSGAADEFKN